MHCVSFVELACRACPFVFFVRFFFRLFVFFEAEGSLKTIPPDNYLKPYRIAALEAAQPMLNDIESDPGEQINLAGRHPEIVVGLRAALDAHWTPKIAKP